MLWFLDMCILIFYASQDNSFFSRKTAEFFASNKGGRFLVCYYIAEWDFPKWARRQKILIDEAIKKIKDASYDLNSSKGYLLLYPREKQKIEKIIFKSKSFASKEEYISRLLSAQKALELRILGFIKNRAGLVIPVKEIDSELKSALLNFMGNVSDAHIIASGIQQHNKEEISVLTGDKKDWAKGNIEWALGSKPQLSKKYHNIPEISYIQDIGTG